MSRAARSTPTAARERRFQRLMRQEQARPHKASEVWGRATIRFGLQQMEDLDPADLEDLFEYDGFDLEENAIMAHVEKLEQQLERNWPLPGAREIEYVLERCAAYIERQVRARRPVSLAMARVYEVLATGVGSWQRKAGAA